MERVMIEKKKKSSGQNGIAQDLLLQGAEIIVKPLLRIINNSIKNWTFPAEWKKAMGIRILKKGNQNDKKLQTGKLPNISTHGP